MLRAVHIGFSRCGGRWLADAFARAGLRVRHDLDGALAEDAAFARLAGREPFQRWPQAAFLGHLENPLRPAVPLAEPFRDVAWLAKAMPHAVFLLPLRPVEAWIDSRMAAHGGAIAARHARHHDLPLGEIPALWAGQWSAHLAAVSNLAPERVVSFQHGEADWSDWRRALAPWVDLPDPPRLVWPVRGAPVPPVQAPAVSARVVASRAERLAELALARVTPGPAPHPRDVPRASSHAVRWVGGDLVHDAQDRRPPILRDPAQPGAPFRFEPEQPVWLRAAGLLSEVAAHGREGGVCVDLQDARTFGTPAAPLPGPVLAYCRRPAARNVVLWPLPGLHSPGSPDFLGRRIDEVPFEEKRDLVVWRGNLTGVSRKPSRGTRTLLADLDAAIVAADPDAVRASEAALATVPRMAFLLAHAACADVDAGLVLSDYLQRYAELPQVWPWCLPRLTEAEMRGYRYRLSLPGYDTASNALLAAESDSLWLRAEDGWQLYWTELFRPWAEYVPLAVDAADLPEKLAWARAHPDECAAIRARAHAACEILACEETRAAALRRVLAALPEPDLSRGG